MTVNPTLGMNNVGYTFTGATYRETQLLLYFLLQWPNLGLVSKEELYVVSAGEPEVPIAEFIGYITDIAYGINAQ